MKRVMHLIADDLGVRGGAKGVIFELRGERDWISDAADCVAFELSILLQRHAEFQRRYGS